jgi:hypothetical protein
MPKTLTIVFRGLLVFHQLSITGQPKIFEIGILPEKMGHDSEGMGHDMCTRHVPRIMTIRNGVLESTTPLQTAIDDTPGIWRLVIDKPVSMGVTTRQSDTTSDKVDRNKPPIPDDFRLIINLANDEFPYKKISGKPIDPTKGTQLDFSQLPVVVQVPSGDFYTRLQSEPLNIIEDPPNGTPKPFGVIAGVIGCDISLDGDKADLIGPGIAAPVIFSFKADPNAIYEFSNSPPDTAEHPGPQEASHFMNYYRLFHPAAKKFDLQRQQGGPGPNPALCGVIDTGESDEPLK